ncbi:MAG TPA: DoxX family protein [Vicinamibacterales bacterium]|jgi:putative oxidoreductase
MDDGLLMVRLVFGLMMAAHGAQKLFGWFGGYGLTATAGFFETVGFRPGRLMAFAAGFGEFASGLLVAAGALGPIGPALMLSVMVVASSMHWSKGLFVTAGGIEVPLLYAAVAAGLAFTGFGALSVDGALGLNPLWSGAIIGTALAVGIAGAIVVLATRRAPVAAKVTA